MEGEYRKKAKDVDRNFGGFVAMGKMEGPVEKKLQEFGDLRGLVFGAFAEASEDVHGLIQSMAESRIAAADLMRAQPGAEPSRESLSVVVGQLRRRLSVAVVRANSNCLLTRLTYCGEGTEQATKRRQWREREERIMRQERESQWHRKVRGHGIRHRGEFVVNE